MGSKTGVVPWAATTAVATAILISIADRIGTSYVNPRIIGLVIARAVPIALFLCTTTTAAAQDRPAHSCVIIQELKAEKPLVRRGDSCDTPLSPASTFKIPHALVALETGVVKPDSVEKWDGTRYERQVKWNQDHTVISSLKPSVLWFYQRIAPRIGAARMSEWLAKFDYGNRDVTGPITEYWVNGRLQISAVQQVAFLRKLFIGTLPVQPRHVAVVRKGLEQLPGMQENALGVHDLRGDWAQALMTAKTGATTTDKYRVSWLVGHLRVNKREYVFASVVWQASGALDTLTGTHEAVAAFIEAKLLPPDR
jgi:beta-lactamase class D